MLVIPAIAGLVIHGISSAGDRSPRGDVWEVEDRRTSDGMFLFDERIVSPDAWCGHRVLNERDVLVIGKNLLRIERAT